ncbi:VanW family protein [Planomicrobium sp. CPCC 101079]|uniref:VanW family protein n=1 Tax=Planomicrobium sp. CPCC 101079 TaxID=2599618 RepID=UPI0011B3F156|nr:VanW family protein [Planomicrobium sp. CPCC 101079]TWT09011.1 hypothetical protein FQV28_05075 [Planomicrobium sp. CPCC 101079]
MDNKVFGTAFISIISIALLLFGVANAGAAAVDHWIFPAKEFGDHTYIGTTNVSKMEVASAMAKVSETAEAWRETAELSVTYQDATANYPLENAEVLLEETAGQAQSGMQNSFIFQLEEATTAAFLAEQFPVAEFSASEVEKITSKLEQALQSGIAQTHVTISDDSLGIDRSAIAEVVFPLQPKSDGAAAIVEAIDEIQIAPGTKFSFLDFISELQLAEVTDGELTEIASAIYTAVLKTNFSVEERSIGTAVPQTVPIGQEAAINRSLGIDLVFTNPNASSFTLNAAFEGNSLAVTLTGFPLVYEYALQTGSKETVKPRLIKQYSAFVSSGKAVEEEGSEGIRIQVLRSIVSEGKELEIETVSTDFYPPVNRVELHPLAVALPESVPAAAGTVTGTAEIPAAGSTAEEAAATEGEQTPVDSSTESSNEDSAGSTSSTAEEDAAEGQDGSTNPDSEDSLEPSEPVYDKGGNLVHP